MDGKKIHVVRMKLLILSTKLPYPPRDGGAIATLNLAAGLADTGVEVSMLTFNTSKHYTDPGTLPADLREKITFHTVDKDTSIRPLMALINLIFSRKPYIAARFRDRKFRKKLIDLLASGGFDFVQMEGPYLAHYIPDIRRCCPAGIALRAHNVEHRIWEKRRQHETGPLRKFYFRLLAKRIRKLEEDVLRRIDLLIPISAPDADLLGSEKNLPSITIPAGLNMEEYPLASGESGNDICFIGALDWAPNQEGLAWFIDLVLSKVLDEKPGAKLHVAGRNAPQGLSSLLSHPAVVFHGEVEDAKAYMCKCGILAVPLLTGSGIRIKILEGMAMGMSVITTTVGAAGLPVVNGKHLYIEDDPQQFAQRLLEMLGNHSGQQTIGTEARKMIRENFDTFTIASRLGELYKKMA